MRNDIDGRIIEFLRPSSCVTFRTQLYVGDELGNTLGTGVGGTLGSLEGEDVGDSVIGSPNRDPLHAAVIFSVPTPNPEVNPTVKYPLELYHSG